MNKWLLIFQVILIILKLTGFIGVSWWVIMLPLIATVIEWLVIFIVVYLTN